MICVKDTLQLSSSIELGCRIFKCGGPSVGVGGTELAGPGGGSGSWLNILVKVWIGPPAIGLTK